MALCSPDAALLSRFGALLAALALLASGCSQQSKLAPLPADAVLIGTPEIGFTLTPPDFYSAIAKQFGVPYEGDVLTRILRNGELKSDQVHPNAKGYLRMAERVADLLRKSGAL